jgi:hypothetical protein
MENRKIILKIVGLFPSIVATMDSCFFTISKIFCILYASYYCSNYVFNGIWEDFTSKKSTLCIGLIFRRSSLLPTLQFCYRKIDFYMNSDKYILEQLMVKKENTNLPIIERKKLFGTILHQW